LQRPEFWKPSFLQEESLSMTARAEILARIERAALAAGRDPADVTLVAVSKQQAWEAIAPILDEGQTVFGENRVQEAQERWNGVRDERPDLELRLIGPLQTNKVRQAMALFDVIETVDRLKLAQAIAAEAQRSGEVPRLYVQINTGSEPQKAGAAPKEADDLIRACRDLGLQIEGLMAIPPAEQKPDPHFRLLAEIAALNGIENLSMGMSADFEAAVACGATSVRVGSALFGARDPQHVVRTDLTE
jgi:pyridoxal phosphate enzyme (YggS family)